MLMFFCFRLCFDLFNEICCRKPPGGMFYGISPITQREGNQHYGLSPERIFHCLTWWAECKCCTPTHWLHVECLILGQVAARNQTISWWMATLSGHLFLLKTSRPAWSTWSKGRHLRLWLRTALPPTAGTLRCETWPAIWNMGRAPRAAWSTCWWFCAWTHLRWPIKRLLLGLLTRGQLLTPQSPCRPQLTLRAVPFDQLSCNHRG